MTIFQNACKNTKMNWKVLEMDFFDKRFEV